MIRHPDTARLTWVGSPQRDACGCVGRRSAEFGDVVVEQCFEHAWDGVRAALTGLAELVAGKHVTRADVAKQVASETTRLGPGSVRLLEDYFESEVARMEAEK